MADTSAPATTTGGTQTAAPQKNIILLSDGTGNSAAAVWRSNVWRTFQSLDLTDSSQVANYDDGVGTSSFKPLAIVGGAFGYGLKRNVLDIYSFLCRNYTPDSEIFALGFSRGAYTIRVVLGLIASQGIVPYESESELRSRARAAYRAYRRDRFHTIPYTEYPFRVVRDWILSARDWALGRKQFSTIERRRPKSIRFVGLWDTVAAYGTPIEELTTAISHWIFPMELPDRDPGPTIKRGCHALAIDDERTTFHPLLWNEEGEKEAPKKPDAAGKLHRWVADERISQVWFSGVHSNVGGGYPDDSLAHIPLYWILGEARRCGLRLKENPAYRPNGGSAYDPPFEPNAFKLAKSARDKDGRLYDSRKGLGGYYRYGPRKMRDLCNVTRSWISAFQVKIDTPKIHCSVFERIKNGAHGYAPIGLPARYAVVSDEGEILDPADNLYENPGQAQKRGEVQERIWNLVWQRRVNYFITLGFTLLFLAFPLYILSNIDKPSPDLAAGSPLAFIVPAIQMLGSVLPGFVAKWVEAYATDPLSFVILGALVVGLVLRGVSLGNKITDEMRALWEVIIHQWDPPPGSLPSGPIYWLRTQPWYPPFIGAMKRHVLPFILLVLIVYFGFVVVSRVLFASRSSLGFACRGAPPAALQRPPAGARSRFDTRMVCWPSGIQLHKGVTYRLVLEQQSTWFDSGIATTPLGFGRDGMTPAMYLALPLRRDIGKNWFQVIARVGRYGLDEHALDFTQEYDPQRRLSFYAATLTPRTDGELFLFVNDAVIGIPGLTRTFYRNNVGDAVIKVDLAPGETRR